MRGIRIIGRAVIASSPIVALLVGVTYELTRDTWHWWRGT